MALARGHVFRSYPLPSNRVRETRAATVLLLRSIKVLRADLLILLSLLLLSFSIFSLLK